MATAGLNTSGFNVGVMPGGFQLANPAYFNPLGATAQGVGSGLGIAGQLADIAYRRQQQQQQAELLPLQMAMQQAQLARAQQQMAVPDIVWGDQALIDQTQNFPAALDENGQPTGQPSVEIGDLIRETKGTQYLPGGQTKAVTKRETVKVAADRKAEADNRESLFQLRADQARQAEERLALTAERDRLRAENDRIKADAMKTRADFLASNPALDHRTIERNGRKFIQYFQKGKPAEVVEEVDAGVYNNSVFAPGAIFQTGGGLPAGSAPVQTAQGDDDLSAILSGKYSTPAPVAAQAAPARQAPAQLPAVQFSVPSASQNLPTVRTKSEWEALPKGSSYLGVDGKTYIKGS